MSRNEKPLRPVDRTLPPHLLGPLRKRATGAPRRSSICVTCRGGSAHGGPHGYVVEYSPDHPRCDKRGMVLQHRLVMECMIGRLLEPHEVVHHRDHDRTNNRPANLTLMDSKSEHGRSHGKDTRQRSLVPLTEEQVRIALDGRTTLQAAKHLGVHHMTLRNRFPHLLKKRRSPGAGFPDDVVSRVRLLAGDPTVSTRDAERVTGMSTMTLQECCRIHQIEWIAAPSGTPSHRWYKASDGARSPQKNQQAR